MESRCIADLCRGDTVEGYYVLNDAVVKTTGAGKPFLSAAISDCSGSMDAKVWDFTGSVGSEDNGRVVFLRGEVTEYRGALQMTVQRFRFASETDRYDVSALVPTAPIDVEDAFEALEDYLQSIEDADYRSIAELLFRRHRDTLHDLPAAKSVHHAFRSGLLMHTVNMLSAADKLASLYSEVIDRSLLLAGTLLHDIGKAREFDTSALGLVTGYSVAGDLLGHLVMGAQEVAEAARELDVPEEKSMLLQHMLLAHHGLPERGAAVVPRCAEAELLSMIDGIDSRMEIYAEALASTPAGGFSPRIYALDKSVYRHN